MSTDMSKIETELIEHIRIVFKEELIRCPDLNTQWNLARFCRARNYDVKKVEKMLDHYFKWRKEKNIQAISAMPLDIFQPLIDVHETGLYGTTREGLPIVIERLGFTNVKELLKPEYDDIRENYMLRLYEGIFTIVLPIASQTISKRVDKLFIIYDVKNVNLPRIFDSKFQQFMKFMIATVQDYYPELLGKLIVVNASFLIKSAWTIVKPWLDKKTRKKIELYGDVPLQEIGKYVDINKLPEFLGGKNKTPLKDNHGPWKKHVDLAFQRKTFILEDRTPEFMYFYTEDEKKKAIRRIEMNNFYGTASEQKVKDEWYLETEENIVQEVRHVDVRMKIHYNSSQQ